MKLCEIHPHIFRITLPLPGKRPGPVNVYLFPRPPVTLIDTGTSRSAGELEAALAQLGIGFGDIDRLVVTHGHLDHYGAARRIRNTGGGRLQVLAHRADARHIETNLEVPAGRYARFLGLMGMPFAMRILVFLMFTYFQSLAEGCPVDTRLADGDELDLGGFRARVIATPGHTRGSICIWLPEAGLLFAGDHLLGHITPNALVMLEETSDLPVRRSQAEFYASLERIRETAPRLVHPAHGRPIEDYERMIQIYHRAYAQREAKILDILDGRRQTVYQVARRLFPELKWNLRYPLELFLAVSEVYSHLQMLEGTRRITWRREGGRIRVAKRNGA